MEVVEYRVDTIGTNTLLGMLCRRITGPVVSIGEGNTFSRQVDVTWKVDDIVGKKVVINYTFCFMSQAKLVAEVHQLYELGASEVELIRWEPPRIHYRPDGSERHIPARRVE